MTDATTGGDRHPVARLGQTIARLPRYLVLARRLVTDSAIPRWRRAALTSGLVYLASPIDLVPGLIPVAGQLDDLAAVLLGLRVALGGCTPEAAATHLEAAGLDAGDLARDLATVRATAGWLGRRVGRGTAKAAAVSARVAGATVKVAGRGALVGLRAAGRALRARTGRTG